MLPPGTAFHADCKKTGKCDKIMWFVFHRAVHVHDEELKLQEDAHALSLKDRLKP